MFGFLKPAQGLEKDLRDWYAKDYVRIHGEQARTEAVEYASSKRVQYLIEDVMNSIVTRMSRAEGSLRLSGKKPSASDLSNWKSGMQLAEAVAKANGWRLEPDEEGCIKAK